MCARVRACCYINVVIFQAVCVVFGGGVHIDVICSGTALQAGRSWLRYFDCYLSLTQSFRPHCDHGLNSVSNRNEYQRYFLKGTHGRYVGLTTLPFPCADWKFVDPQPPGAVSACPESAVPLLCLTDNPVAFLCLSVIEELL